MAKDQTIVRNMCFGSSQQASIFEFKKDTEIPIVRHALIVLLAVLVTRAHDFRHPLRAARYCVLLPDAKNLAATEQSGVDERRSSLQSPERFLLLVIFNTLSSINIPIAKKGAIVTFRSTEHRRHVPQEGLSPQPSLRWFETSDRLDMAAPLAVALDRPRDFDQPVDAGRVSVR